MSRASIWLTAAALLVTATTGRAEQPSAPGRQWTGLSSHRQLSAPTDGRTEQPSAPAQPTAAAPEPAAAPESAAAPAGTEAAAKLTPLPLAPSDGCECGGDCGCCEAPHEGVVRKLVRFFTYVPLPKDGSCECCHHCGCHTPPLYTYFLCMGCTPWDRVTGSCGCGH